MLYDLFFSLGGDTLVQIMNAIITPIFTMVCERAIAFGGSWTTMAELIERLVS